MTVTADRVVLGGGLAGCAVAIALARAGTPPLVLERTVQTRPRLCGGFLRAESAQALAALGIDVAALGARPTRRLRLSQGPRSIEAELPANGWGLSRTALDSALQQAAVAAGATLLRGVRAAVEQVPGRDGGHGFVLRLDRANAAMEDAREDASDGVPTTIHTPTLLLATGKSDLAPLARQPRHAPPPLVGLQTMLRLAPEQARALEGCVEVMLFDDDAGGYAGLQAVEGGRANLCLLTQRSPARPGLPALLASLQRDCPALAERLHGATWLDAVPQTIARVPYGHVHRACDADPPGLWRLGDQAAVIASYTGAGMAIALHSAQLAGAELLAGATPLQYHRRLHDDLAAQVGRAQALYRLGRSRLGRGALWALLSRWPGALRFVANATQIVPPMREAGART